MQRRAPNVTTSRPVQQPAPIMIGAMFEQACQSRPDTPMHQPNLEALGQVLAAVHTRTG